LVLRQIFIDLVTQYDCGLTAAESLWLEISQSYSKKKRHYHNLSHLQAMYEQLNNNRPHIQDWDTILLSLFYHDIVYKVTSKTNEKESAKLAMKRLNSIAYPEALSNRCYDHILATASHQQTNDPDTNLFTDADLSILGQERNTYETYCIQIRKEYSIYPDILYKPGRKKLVLHFLEMDRIFKTDHFFNRFEQTARENLNWELQQLSGKA
jgi:predicted metal-dependent HD superfamily phosphohydrolase